jgi:hypothetical protein
MRFDVSEQTCTRSSMVQYETERLLSNVKAVRCSSYPQLEDWIGSMIYLKRLIGKKTPRLHAPTHFTACSVANESSNVGS